jgi:hypothetical protein
MVERSGHGPVILFIYLILAFFLHSLSTSVIYLIFYILQLFPSLLLCFFFFATEGTTHNGGTRWALETKTFHDASQTRGE